MSSLKGKCSANSIAMVKNKAFYKNKFTTSLILIFDIAMKVNVTKSDPTRQNPTSFSSVFHIRDTWQITLYKWFSINYHIFIFSLKILAEQQSGKILIGHDRAY